MVDNFELRKVINSVYSLMALCFMAISAVHAWECVYLSAVGISYQLISSGTEISVLVFSRHIHLTLILTIFSSVVLCRTKFA
jgi:hypothetical protein